MWYSALLFVFSIIVVRVEGAGKRKETTVPDNVYDTMLARLEGDFCVPKKRMVKGRVCC